MFAKYSSSTSLGSLYSLSKYSFHLLRTSAGSVRTLPSSPLIIPSPGACVCVILLIPSYTALVLLLTLLFFHLVAYSPYEFLLQIYWLQIYWLHLNTTFSAMIYSNLKPALGISRFSISASGIG